jgi:acetyltransferase-like isoleucine patch superfamily enzyme
MNLKKIIKFIVPVSIIRVALRTIVSRKYDVKFGNRAFADLETFFEGRNHVNKNSSISKSYVGLGTYIAGHTSLSRIKIGRFCSIGQRLKTNLGIHPTHFVSTHPSFYSSKKQAGFSFVKKTIFKEHRFVDHQDKYLIEIGNDVWIGNDVVIMDGVKVGDGAIIGAGALVTKNIPPYSVVGGVPAKIIKMRFDQATIDKLLSVKWWNRDFEWIKNNADSFSNVTSFIKIIGPCIVNESVK